MRVSRHRYDRHARPGLSSFTPERTTRLLLTPILQAAVMLAGHHFARAASSPRPPMVIAKAKPRYRRQQSAMSSLRAHT